MHGTAIRLAVKMIAFWIDKKQPLNAKILHHPGNRADISRGFRLDKDDSKHKMTEKQAVFKASVMRCPTWPKQAKGDFLDVLLQLQRFFQGEDLTVVKFHQFFQRQVFGLQLMPYKLFQHP